MENEPKKPQTIPLETRQQWVNRQAEYWWPWVLSALCAIGAFLIMILGLSYNPDSELLKIAIYAYPIGFFVPVMLYVLSKTKFCAQRSWIRRPLQYIVLAAGLVLIAFFGYQMLTDFGDAVIYALPVLLGLNLSWLTASKLYPVDPQIDGRDEP